MNNNFDFSSLISKRSKKTVSVVIRLAIWSALALAGSLGVNEASTSLRLGGGDFRSSSSLSPSIK